MFRSEKPSEGDEGAERQPVSNRGPAYWKKWEGPASHRPTRALFLDFGMALLGRSDSLTLSRLLAVRSLMGGMLNNLATDPPGFILRLLKLLAHRCLGAAGEGETEVGTQVSVPAALRHEVFADVALQQLALVVLHLEDFDAAGDENLGEEGMHLVDKSKNQYHLKSSLEGG